MIETEILDEPLRFVCDSPDRLDSLLVRMAPEYSRTKLSRLIESGGVVVNGEVQTKSGIKIKAGWTIEFIAPDDEPPHGLAPYPMELSIVFEDEYIIVIDKPRGLATHPAASLKEPSLVNGLLARGGSLSTQGGAFRPGIVHRLDKETTGLIVVAKTDAAHVALARQFETKQAERRYVGIVAGEPDQKVFDINAPIARDPKNRQRMAVEPDGKSALTHCRLAALVPAGTLMAFRLSTGRTHQIRVHMRAIGHPILGDPVYAPPILHKVPLQLHAAFLAFDHPIHGSRVESFAMPPDDFLANGMVDRSTVDWPDDDQH